MEKLPNPRQLVVDKEVKVSIDVYGRKSDKRFPPKQYFEVHSEDFD